MVSIVHWRLSPAGGHSAKRKDSYGTNPEEEAGERLQTTRYPTLQGFVFPSLRVLKGKQNLAYPVPLYVLAWPQKQGCLPILMYMPRDLGNNIS